MGKTTRIFSDDDLITIKTLYENGENTTTIARKYGCDPSTAQDWLKRTGVEMRGNAACKRLYQLREDAFASIKDEAAAYWLGFLCADGCVSEKRGCRTTGLVLGKKDVDHLQKFLAFLESDCPLKIEPRYGTIGVHLYSTKLSTDLIALGCTPRKSATLAFPDMPVSLIHHFVRGYFDGDGSVSYIGSKYRDLHLSFVGNKKFLECLSKIVATLTGAAGQITAHSVSKVAYYLHYRGAFKAHHVVQWMYADATIWLGRKRKAIESFPQGKRSGYPTAHTYVGTAGSVSAETIRRYIMECQGK